MAISIPIYYGLLNNFICSDFIYPYSIIHYLNLEDILSNSLLTKIKLPNYNLGRYQLTYHYYLILLSFLILFLFLFFWFYINFHSLLIIFYLKHFQMIIHIITYYTISITLLFYLKILLNFVELIMELSIHLYFIISILFDSYFYRPKYYILRLVHIVLLHSQYRSRVSNL